MMVDEAGEERGSAGSTPICICVRRTLDWTDADSAYSQMFDYFRKKADTWNNTFNMPYHVFRHRIRSIAESNLANVTGARVLPMEELPDGALVIPIDDDDWLNPEVAGRLRENFGEGLTGYHWQLNTISVSDADTYQRVRGVTKWALRGFKPRRGWVCHTNNYAVMRKRVSEDMILHHVKADKWFRRNPSNVKYIDEPLGIWNRTMASQTSMGWGKNSVSRSRLVKIYEKFSALYDGHDVRGIPWTTPYVKMMAELMREIRPM